MIAKMKHRHLTHQAFTLAAIDDIILRGKREDWEDLRDAIRQDQGLLKKIMQICLANMTDPYAQRYHFWFHYAKKHTT